MIKVAVILASLEAGGAESRMVDIFKNIDKTQYQLDFIVLSNDENQFYENELLSYGAEIIKLNKPREISIFTHVKQVVKAFKLGGYTVVHSNTSYHSGLILLIAFISRIKVRIAHARTNDLRNKSIKNAIITFLGKVLIRIFATDRLAISKESAEFLYGKNKHVVIVPDAIEINKFCFFDKDRLILIRHDLNLSEDETIIGHVGRFDYAKNQEFVIKVFQAYHQVNSRSKLLLVGNGELKEKCETIVSELGLKEDVFFLGAKSNIDEYMNLFDVLLFPSKYEGLGNVALEAQAAGTPCICSLDVPKTVDMGLGLVEFLSLDDNLDNWIKIIAQKIAIKDITKEKIVDAFVKQGYTIDNSVLILSCIYDGGENGKIHNKI